VTDYMDRRSCPVAAITPPVEAGTGLVIVPFHFEAGMEMGFFSLKYVWWSTIADLRD
jgi:hypothetical protein